MNKKKEHPGTGANIKKSLTRRKVQHGLHQSSKAILKLLHEIAWVQLNSNILINELPAHHTSYTGFSVLFADDLTTSLIFNKMTIKDCGIETEPKSR